MCFKSQLFVELMCTVCVLCDVPEVVHQISVLMLQNLHVLLPVNTVFHSWTFMPAVQSRASMLNSLETAAGRLV